MSRPRFSIAGLMIVVLFCAVGAAALRSSSGLWADVLFTLTLAMLGVAILGLAYRRGARRASWAGFALFGGGYLLACFGPWFATEVRPHLATTPLLGYLRSRIGPAEVLLGEPPREHERVGLGERALELPGDDGEAQHVEHVRVGPDDIFAESALFALEVAAVRLQTRDDLELRIVGGDPPADIRRASVRHAAVRRADRD